MKTSDVVFLSDLKIGDIIRNRGGVNSYVVIGTYGKYAIAVREVIVTHPEEWLKIERDDDEQSDIQITEKIAHELADMLCDYLVKNVVSCLRENGKK